jgi:antitoxin component YwqK of YwqJK toxin-antitoxin module
MHGPYREWWPSGKPSVVGQYVYGKAEGRWQGWYETGELQGEEWFVKGKVVRSVYYDKKGHVVSEPET